jgi:hypothetical protein
MRLSNYISAFFVHLFKHCVGHNILYISELLPAYDFISIQVSNKELL